MNFLIFLFFIFTFFTFNWVGKCHCEFDQISLLILVGEYFDAVGWLMEWQSLYKKMFSSVPLIPKGLLDLVFQT